MIIPFAYQFLGVHGMDDGTAFGKNPYINGGGLLALVVWTVLIGWLFKRWQRVMPMIIAHALIDSVAFIGYALLAGHVGWLPG